MQKLKYDKPTITRWGEYQWCMSRGRSLAPMQPRHSKSAASASPRRLVSCAAEGWCNMIWCESKRCSDSNSVRTYGSKAVYCHPPHRNAPLMFKHHWLVYNYVYRKKAAHIQYNTTVDYTHWRLYVILNKTLKCLISFKLLVKKYRSK